MMSFSKNLAGVSRTNIFITKSSFLLWKNGIFSVNCCRIIFTIPVLCVLGNSLMTVKMANVLVYSCFIIFLSFLTSVLAIPCSLAKERTISTFLFISFSVSVCSVRIAVKWERINDHTKTPSIIQNNVKAVSPLFCEPTSPYPTVVRVWRAHYIASNYTSPGFISPKSLCVY